MKLSIVIPSFNQAHFINQTLNSLFTQRDVRDSELEVIVMDGGSRDGTVEILKQYESRLAYWISGPDDGANDATIKGFRWATGDILGWLCSDDLLEPYTVREVLDTFTAHPKIDWVYGDSKWIDISGNFFWPKKEIPFSKFIWLHDHNYIPQPSCFWRRKLYDQVGGLDPSFHLAHDGDLWARFSIVSRPRHVRRIWSSMRFYPDQKNQRLRKTSDLEDRIIRERMGLNFSSLLKVRARYGLAKAMRVAWKTVYGCYWPLKAPWGLRPR